MSIDQLQNLQKPIFYITNDVSQGVGLENILPNYHIICLDDHPLVDILKKEGVSVFCLEREVGKKNFLFRNAGTILSHPLVISFIKNKSGNNRPNILFFKPQSKIEAIGRQNKFELIGNPVETNRYFEDKVIFYSLCRKNKIKVPPGEINKLSKLNFRDLTEKYGENLVIQFGRGWAGNSTFFINDEESFLALKEKFNQVKVKITKFIQGATYLNNAAIIKGKILVSKPARQIKSHLSLTSAMGGTGGRIWPSGLNLDQEMEINKISLRVGSLMKRNQYKGYFGLDFLVEEKTGEIFLSENNARLTASVPFYTKLELKNNAFPLLGYHLLSFIGGDFKGVAVEPPLVSGSEIVVRNSSKKPVRIGKEVKTGLYGSDNKFKESVPYLKTNNNTDYWLKTAAKERIVNPEIEIGRINTYDDVGDSSGNLKEKYLDIVKKIKAELKLSPC